MKLYSHIFQDKFEYFQNFIVSITQVQYFRIFRKYFRVRFFNESFSTESRNLSRENPTNLFNRKPFFFFLEKLILV